MHMTPLLMVCMCIFTTFHHLRNKLENKNEEKIEWNGRGRGRRRFCRPPLCTAMNDSMTLLACFSFVYWKAQWFKVQWYACTSVHIMYEWEWARGVSHWVWVQFSNRTSQSFILNGLESVTGVYVNTKPKTLPKTVKIKYVPSENGKREYGEKRNHFACHWGKRKKKYATANTHCSTSSHTNWTKPCFG